MDPTTLRLIQGAAGAAASSLYVDDVFSTFLYTGNGSTQTITNGIDLAGEGGLVWIKSRSLGTSHVLTDTARGSSSQLYSDRTNAQGTVSDQVTAFTGSGFSLGTDALGTGTVNASATTYTSWSFRKAPGFFDVVTYTGDGNSTKTLNHSLGSVPGMIIVKKTNGSGQWITYHQSLGASGWLLLNNDGGQDTNNYGNWPFGSTTPTSTQFTVALDGSGSITSDEYKLNVSGDTYVAYLFAHDAGGFGDSGNESVVSCGSFSGTGFVNLGWEPQWIMIKPYSQTYNWEIYDNMRGMGQPAGASSGQALRPNTSGAESGASGISFEATGFTQTTFGASYPCIYIAIRRGPMKTPTDATEVFDDVTYSGTASPQNISISPNYTDLVFIKRRTSADPPVWTDRLRGKNKYLRSSGTDAEATWDANDVINFDRQASFGLVSNTTGYVNSSGQPYISYSFRRAPGFFDVVAFLGNAASRTINHNLAAVPELMIFKCRDAAIGWGVYSAALAASEYLVLQTTAATVSSTSIWDNTRPTSTVFSVGSNSISNANNGNMIAYLFATCPGVSKVGSYTGTGTTLNIDCGFAAGARFVLIKRTDSTGDWYVYDTARGIVSGNDPYLLLNSTAAEVTNTDYIDPLSSGFTVTSSAPTGLNASGGTYIFLAIA